MRPITVLLFVILPFSVFCQTFDLNSKSLRPGDVYKPTPPILFQLGSKEILDFSYKQLDSIAEFLKKFDNVEVEIGVHCDQRRPIESSQYLETVRAQSIADYLISKGVNPTFLIPKGYGDTEPLVSQAEIDKLETQEEKEKAYQKNRRVEFIILKVN